MLKAISRKEAQPRQLFFIRFPLDRLKHAWLSRQKQRGFLARECSGTVIELASSELDSARVQQSSILYHLDRARAPTVLDGAQPQENDRFQFLGPNCEATQKGGMKCNLYGLGHMPWSRLACTGSPSSRSSSRVVSRCCSSTPGDVKNVPGRRQRCAVDPTASSVGLLRASFRPRQEIVALRAYLRHRERMVEYAASHVQHMQKALMQMNVQLHHVSDITGVTGMRTIRAILRGQQDPMC